MSVLLASVALLAAGCGVGGGTDASFGGEPQSTRLKVTLLGADGVFRGIFEYDLGDRPRARIALTPALDDRKVTFLAQGKSGGLWLDVRSEVVGTDAEGRVIVRLPRLPEGVYRAAAHFVGDAANAGASSSWVYFRIDR